MTKRLPTFMLLLFAVAVETTCVAQPTPIAPFEDEVSYSRDIRPILSNHCFACHGLDAAARQSDLRLDTLTGATAVHNETAAVVPGDHRKSELWRRVHSNDEAEIMPPPDANKQLTAREKALLRRWIDSGAKYEQHWSLALPRRPLLPAVSDVSWCRTAIDHFILARLDREQLAPSPPANRERLVRRVTLDLTGLPATPDAVTAFAHDTRDDAYERHVDRLMATTAYGERRAQDWLDLARYADTRGFADDQRREIWPYRDWVIRALNRNMPFDQFTIEQLAGDMLPDATTEQRLATAFHRNAPQAKGMTYPVEEYRQKGVIDRVNTTGRVWLGLTIGCAECHDHKFDPIRQTDYYSLFALFNNIEHSGKGFAQGGPTMEYQSADLAARRAQMLTALDRAQASAPPPRLDGKSAHPLGTWQQPTTASDSTKYTVVGDFTIRAMIQTTQKVADIVSKYDWAGQQRSFVFGIGGEGEANSRPGHLFAWISAKPDPFAGVEIYGSRPVNDGRKHEVAVVFEAGKRVRLFVDGHEDASARVAGNVPRSVARSNRRLTIGAGYQGSPQPDAFRFDGSLTHVQLYDRALSTADSKVAVLEAALKTLDKQQVKAVPIMRERSQPRATFVHVRGNFLQRGPQVSPAVPEMFNVAPSQQPKNRLAFAQWLVNGKNPLVARVVVNRIWQQHFGRGLVSTADDLGSQGGLPSHPKLLDWLACEFVSSDWDLKHLHHLIVHSATYRQSAHVRRPVQRHDPENLLLARMPRVRLAAEQIRDQALAVSGLLVNDLGGPAVFPLQPDEYWQQRALPGKWQVSSGGQRYRRTLYTYWRRMALHPSLELLDAPARETCVTRRSLANVPTQALVLLNDPMFHEAAQALAARICREIQAGTESRLDYAFQLVLNRTPSTDEKERFLAFLAHERGAFVAANATAIRTPPAAADGKPIDLAVWTLACAVLLNLDETITRP